MDDERRVAGAARTEPAVTADLLDFYGTPHGGAVSSLADAAFAAFRGRVYLPVE